MGNKRRDVKIKREFRKIKNYTVAAIWSSTNTTKINVLEKRQPLQPLVIKGGIQTLGYLLHNALYSELIGQGVWGKATLDNSEEYDSLKYQPMERGQEVSMVRDIKKHCFVPNCDTHCYTKSYNSIFFPFSALWDLLLHSEDLASHTGHFWCMTLHTFHLQL